MKKLYLFFLLPFIPLSGGILTLIYHFRKENTNLLSNVFIFISLLLSVALIKEIGLEKIRAKCPGFDKWIRKLENI